MLTVGWRVMGTHINPQESGVFSAPQMVGATEKQIWSRFGDWNGN